MKVTGINALQPLLCSSYLVEEMVPLNTVEKPAFKSFNASKIRQAVRVAGQNLLFRDCCAENVQHGKDIDQNGAYEC